MTTLTAPVPPAISRPAGSLPEIHSIGMSVWDPVFSLREHVGPCWEVVHIVRGLVKLHMAGSVFRAGSGDTLLIPAGTPHRDEFPLGSEFEVLHIMFRWRGAPALFPQPVNRELLRLPPVDKQAIREMAFETFDDFKRQRLLWRDMTRAGLYRLLLFLRSATREQQVPRPAGEKAAGKARRRELIQQAKAHIRENLDKPITLAGIAAHLNISACHLSHLFSEESGFTLSSYLGSQRMAEAARLLADSRRRVKEVAFAVGFENPNYFCKAFRRHFGCPPEAYRDRRRVPCRGRARKRT